MRDGAVGDVEGVGVGEGVGVVSSRRKFAWSEFGRGWRRGSIVVEVLASKGGRFAVA